jgi:glycosyltransferase involved in cell wall biosynthesis
MKHNELVSVVIPTFNRSKVVHEAIDSVLTQTYNNIELIIVDDGSTDDTLSQLHRYGDRITVVSQKNGGPAAARNLGILKCNGDLIAFLDSDDVWHTTKIERQISLLSRLDKSVPCCITNIEMRWNDRRITSFDNSWLHTELDEGIWLNVSEVLATRFVLFNQAVMIRRTALEKCGHFDESLRILEDGDLALRLSSEGPWAFIREPLVIWRETAGSAYQNARHDQPAILQAHIKILEANISRSSDSMEERVHELIVSEIKRARRQLKAITLSSTSSPVATMTGALLQCIERCRRYAFLRSPWFPQMKAQRVR